MVYCASEIYMYYVLPSLHLITTRLKAYVFGVAPPRRCTTRKRIVHWIANRRWNGWKPAQIIRRSWWRELSWASYDVCWCSTVSPLMSNSVINSTSRLAAAPPQILSLVESFKILVYRFTTRLSCGGVYGFYGLCFRMQVDDTVWYDTHVRSHRKFAPKLIN